MRVLLQRVQGGSVTVRDSGEAAGREVGRVDQGLVLLVGVTHSDTTADAEKLAAKVAGLRIFSDGDGKFNLSLLDVGGGALVVSQFTLYADARKGRRPNFTAAAAPDHARSLIEHFVGSLRELGVARVETGEFGASMLVRIENDGPVTIWLDSGV